MDKSESIGFKQTSFLSDCYIFETIPFQDFQIVNSQSINFHFKPKKQTLSKSIYTCLNGHMHTITRFPSSIFSLVHPFRVPFFWIVSNNGRVSYSSSQGQFFFSVFCMEGRGSFPSMSVVHTDPREGSQNPPELEL